MCFIEMLLCYLECNCDQDNGDHRPRLSEPLSLFTAYHVALVAMTFLKPSIDVHDIL